MSPTAKTKSPPKAKSGEKAKTPAKRGAAKEGAAKRGAAKSGEKAKPPAKRPAAKRGAAKRPAAKKGAAKRPAAKNGRALGTAGAGTLRARVTVFPRREVLDPQGKAIRDALARIGFDQVTEVRAGKSFDLELVAADATTAGAAVEEMCRRLLANPLIEGYEIELPAEAPA